jgi:parallel beta-helix repeat protein
MLMILILGMTFYTLAITIQLPVKNQYSDIQGTHNRVIDEKIVEIQQYVVHDPIIIISDSEFASQGFNGSGTVDNPYLIEGFNITASPKVDLIAIKFTTVHFTIKNNFLNGLSKASSGITLGEVENGIIENNIVVNHESNGIILTNSNHNVIANNTITNNFIGLRLGLDGDNTVTKNTISKNINSGINSDHSGNNTFSSNVVTGNQHMGILLQMSDESTVIDNNISNNLFQGIFLTASDDCTISSNNFSNNGDEGVHASDSHEIKISNNTIYNNSYEGLILSDSRNFSILNNTVYKNNGYGVLLDELSHNGTISGNNFVGNNPAGGSQACDEGIDNIFENNHWDDWTEPDADGDGFVDDPYSIDGEAGNQDAHPRVSPNPESTPPSNVNIILGFFLLVIILPVLGILIRKQKRT